jgi:hypothetical protein
MALIAVACVTAGAAIDVAKDGGEPSRVGKRAEVPPLMAPVAAGPSRDARTLASSRLPATPPPRIDDLEAELASLDPGTRDLALQKLLPDWVAANPEAAAQFAEAQTDPELRTLALRHVALLWGALDPERAVNWARVLPDAAERDATLVDVDNGLSSVDPARGVELREQFAVATQPDSALSNLVQQWASYDFEAALAWTNARAPGRQRDDLLQRLVYVRAAAGDPAAAARLVADSALTGEAKRAAIASVNQEWEQRDATAAQEWLQTFGPATPN